MVSSAKKPKKTAEEESLERRQRSLLDETIEENEEKFKLLARGKLGRGSLLSGAAITPEVAAGGKTRGSASGVGSLIPGGPRRSATPSSTSGRSAPTGVRR